MTLYKYEFERPESYLHHRPPYLLVDRILKISDTEVTTEKLVNGDEFFIEGHFPGAPILPGAMMQELTTQSAGILIAARHNPMKEFDTSDPYHNEYALGVLGKIQSARYKKFARPGDRLIATVILQDNLSNVFNFEARIEVEGSLIMRNSFQLMNIKSSVLQGEKLTSEPL